MNTEHVARIAKAMNTATIMGDLGATADGWDVGLAYCASEAAAERHVAECERIAARAATFGKLVCKACWRKAATCPCETPARRRTA